MEDWFIALSVVAAFGMGGWINSIIQSILTTKRDKQLREDEFKKAKWLRLFDERRAAYANAHSVIKSFLYRCSPRILLTVGDNLDVDDILGDVAEAIARAELVAGGQVREQLHAAEGQLVASRTRLSAIKDATGKEKSAETDTLWEGVLTDMQDLASSKKKLLEAMQKEIGAWEQR